MIGNGSVSYKLVLGEKIKHGFFMIDSKLDDLKKIDQIAQELEKTIKKELKA